MVHIMTQQKMKTLNRLVKISTYYNRIKDIEFYRDYHNKRIVDARSIVFNIALNDLKYTIGELSDYFNKENIYILELIEHHKSEYKIINYYTQLHDNIRTQFLEWNESKLDLQYSIIKTHYDNELAQKYEIILNENCLLMNENEKLKYKSKKKYYV